MTQILVTGAAGFIGYHVSARLLAEGHAVLGIDNLNAYYDPALKNARLEQLRHFPAFAFEKADIGEAAALERLFTSFRPQQVVHLAAQVGVRNSLQHPMDYVHSNLVGFAHILECCRRHPIEHLLYASSSSVYGGQEKLPFSVNDPLNRPLNLYAATKIANELMAYAYSHLYRLAATGLRFFTVYGPWGRPDMSPFLFTSAIIRGQTIPLYAAGQAQRDFTYIDDVVEAVQRLRTLPWPPTTAVPHRVFNVGGGKPVRIADFIARLEKELGRPAKVENLPPQPEEMAVTLADAKPLEEAIGFLPATPLEAGLSRFVAWYRGYYRR